MKRFVKKHFLLIIFISGLLLRFSLLFVDFGWDVHNHIAWAQDLTERGFHNFYDIQSSEVYASLYPNYPPFALFLFYIFYALNTFIFKLLWLLNVMFSFFPSAVIFFIQKRAFVAGVLKIPAIFADMGLAWVCYLFAKKLIPYDKKLPFFSASTILFNPAFFYNSALWGQIDSIPLFFLMWSFFICVYTKKYIISGLLFTASILVKPTTLIFFPVHVVLFTWCYGLRKGIKALIVGLSFFWVSFLPFFGDSFSFFSPFDLYFKKIISAQSLAFVTNGAFNFWVLITGFDGIRDISVFIFGATYRIWGYVIFSTLTVWVIFILIKAQKKKLFTFFYAFFLSAVISFLFLTKMHERYTMLSLPFLLMMSILNSHYKKWFYIFSLLSLINIYHSWPVPRIELVVRFLSVPFVFMTLSGLNIAFFLVLFLSFIFSQQYTKVPRSGCLRERED